MQLNQLLAAIPHTAFGDQHIAITNISYDSRTIQPGGLFVAIRGYHSDGHQFIEAAINNGAVAVVYDDPQQAPPHHISAAQVTNSKIALAPLAAAFYAYPAHKLDVIGITGSKGKTSTTFLTAAALEASGASVGFISTVDFKIAGQQWANTTRQSTPEALEIQAMLNQMVDAGCRYAVVESTSHGLSPRWNRLGECAFDIALITNVTHEHLDYHGSVEQYRQDKAELFRALTHSPVHKQIKGQRIKPVKVAIVNADDPHADIYIQAAGSQVRHLRYGIHAPTLDLRAYDIKASSSGTRFKLQAPCGQYDVNLHLVGPFYVYNVLAALSVASARNIDLQQAIARLETITGIEGRMEQVIQGQPFSVLIDYAHNPDSFEQVMSMMRPLTKGRLIAVFGSAGERDKEKRFLQGAIAARWCDLIFLTDEDPRGEDRHMILEDIAQGVASGGKRDKCVLVADRQTAIYQAFQTAQADDVVLLLGKGHESSIIYADHSVPWNERSVAQASLAQLGYSDTP